ncbi:thiolase family protein [Roseibium polysiphoniae]|uniref:Thiolase family protein n=1 Tax=Roseibium polysiphoniae TaxID=2571221 RepID=A0ABR9CCY4_9HYPH|nr:thiolase family protein [Roseibium polysiphoniae]MBD8877756.1 thiolase family protein [Roseibium polysiphoniae]
MTAHPLILAARRTAVAPRGGAFRALQADELAAPVIEALLADAGVDRQAVDHVIFGNALYGGGNPARLAALRAGLPDRVPALTLDTQCCSGLDAILMASHLVRSGAARCVIAGGMESYSRAPIRMHRPTTRDEKPAPYDRPAFAPFPERDPDLTAAAASLAAELEISRQDQADYAVCSHAKAISATKQAPDLTEFVILPEAPLERDAFARPLTQATALRAPVLAGDRGSGVSAATVAVEADAAAAVLVVEEGFVQGLAPSASRLARTSILDGVSRGGPPEDAARVPIDAMRTLLTRLGKRPEDFAGLELMEAYAVQAMATVAALGWPEDRINRSGGALGRGHPIGASGAILAVRLFHELQREVEGATGLCSIAAAGGLGTALALSR